MCQDENKPKDESFHLFWTQPVANEPGPQDYDSLKDRFICQALVFVNVLVFVLAHEQANIY